MTTPGKNMYVYTAPALPHPIPSLVCEQREGRGGCWIASEKDLSTKGKKSKKKKKKKKRKEKRERGR